LQSNQIAKRGIISRVLEPALYLWLRSQVESAELLKVHLDGGDRQVLTGYLPRVRLEASQVIYQGLHLSSAQLTGKNIRINIGQILKGKSFQLLEAVPVDLTVQLNAPDLQRSLSSPLLQDALIETLLTLVGEQLEDVLGDLRSQSLKLQSPILTLGENQIRFSSQLISQDGLSMPVAIQSGLVLDDPHTLKLQSPEWLPTANARRGLPLQEFEDYRFDLGEQCQLSDLSISSDGIHVSGLLSIASDL
jgi:LmeA-like phospholipid-binding